MMLMKQRQGFTLIEVLVAIGILLILMALVTVGFRTLGNSGRANDTKMMLENARSLLAEPGIQDRVKRVFADTSDPTGTKWDDAMLSPGTVLRDSYYGNPTDPEFNGRFKSLAV